MEELKKQHEVNIDCINSDILKINAKLPFWCNGERSMKMLKFDFIKEFDQYKLQSLLVNDYHYHYNNNYHDYYCHYDLSLIISI